MVFDDPQASEKKVNICLPTVYLAFKHMMQDVNEPKKRMSFKLNITCLFSMGDTVIDKHINVTEVLTWTNFFICQNSLLFNVDK